MVKPAFSHTRLSEGARFTLAFILYGAAALLQLFLFPGNGAFSVPVRFGGILLILIPLWFLKARNFSNKPKDQGKEDWKAVTMTELDRLADRIRTIKKVKIPFIYTANFAVLSILLIILIFGVSVWGFGLGAAFAALDICLLFIPWFWFARVDRWYPLELAEKLDLYHPVITASLPDSVEVSPMLRFDEDEKGDKIPEDIKIMLRVKNGPEDLLGAQFQLGYNDGPNGKVPYMYAVFITRGRGKIWQTIGKARFPHYALEADASPGEAGEYGTVVLRLDPDSRADGYHTKPEAVAELAGHVAGILGKIGA
jgi:hypothetical protein